MTREDLIEGITSRLVKKVGDKVPVSVKSMRDNLVHELRIRRYAAKINRQIKQHAKKK